MEKASQSGYLEGLRERRKKSHVYVRHQSIGLALARLLDDKEHKTLYIGLAKHYDGEYLISIAKDVSTRKNIKNLGAYFMSVIKTKGIKPKKRNSKKISKKIIQKKLF